MNQFVLPEQFITDSNGNPLAGAKVRFYRTGTLETLTVYQDALYAAPHDPENITADANGRLPFIAIQDELYKVAVYDDADVLIMGPYDNLTGQLDLDSIAANQEQYKTEIQESQVDFTISVSDVQSNAFFNAKPISANITATLPSAAEVGNGYGITIRNGYASSYKITVVPKPASGETLDGASSIEITTYNEQVRLVSDGANWIVSKYQIPDEAIDVDQLAPRLQGAFLATGQIVPWVGDPAEAPAGWLAAEGQIVNIADYPDLHTKLGVMYGGDGVTTFGVPDLRGYFLRGFDNGAGIDPDAASRTARPDGVSGDNIGTTQGDQFESHTHTNSVTTDGDHVHDYEEGNYNGEFGTGGNHGSIGKSTKQTISAGAHSHTVTIDSTGGNETRPTNFAVRWYIVAAPELSAGASGVLTKIHSVTGAPSDTLGINGDFAIDATNNNLYGPKAGGSWPSAIDLTGADGFGQVFAQASEPASFIDDNALWVRSTDGQVFISASGTMVDQGFSLKGADGAAGVAGADGADGADGAPGLNWTGDWSGATAYSVNDGVLSNGTSYICTVAHTNQEPPNASYWDTLASKGTDGVGTGDVTGPASSTDNTIPRFDSTTGKVIQGSGVTIDDSNNITGAGTVNGRNLSTDGAKLDGIEDNATADQTGAEIKTAYEAQSNTNAYTDAEQAKLAAIEAAATADQTDAEIETAYNNQVSVVSQAEAEAGTATTRRGWTAQRVAQAIAALAGGGGGGDLFHIQDQKSSGTDGGTFTSGSYQTRDLNTSLVNNISGASLSSNVITLPAGTYEVLAFAAAYDCSYHQLRIRNTTDSATLCRGIVEYANATNNVATTAVVAGHFTLAATKDIELQHRCNNTKSSTGLGLAASFGTEVYADIQIRKVG